MTGTENIPWKIVDSDLGDVPFYVIQFGKHGNCTSPRALEHLVNNSKTKTDVFVFSHGWNNDWAAATGRYDRFVQNFTEVRTQQWRSPDRSFAPVLVGVFWPSTALVAPWERGPDIAAAEITDPEVAELADDLEPDKREAFLRIVSDPGGHDPAELARILAPLLPGGKDEIGCDGGPVSAEDLLGVWEAIVGRHPASSPTRHTDGFIEDEVVGSDAVAPPTPASWNPIEWIRDGIRATTVMIMKDRAGHVGGTGVAEMLRQLLDASADARISLVGHSYGAKVVLSALCNGPAPSRKVDSALLLQPALSCLAFAANVGGRPGGYRTAFERVRLPIITTHSRHDKPLTRWFHLAVRRKSDLAEAVIAAEPGRPPSKFSALGGYGPQGIDEDVERIDMPAVGTACYPLSTGKRVISVDGTSYISSHGAVETPETAWALLSQVRA